MAGWRRVAVLALAALALAACAGEPEPLAIDPPQDVTEPEAEPVLALAATVAPLADLVAQVAGDRATVASLVPVGADSHTYEPVPADVRVVEEADAFFGNGLGLNPAGLRLAEANLPEGAPVVLLAEETVPEEALITWDGEGHVHGDDDGHVHGDAGHVHGDDAGQTDDAGHTHPVDPHVWTDVTHAIAFLDVIERTLSDLDPAGAETYAKNAAEHRGVLEDLDTAIAEAVATIPEAHRKLVTYHDAWGYFGARYGLEVVAAVQPSDFAEPSAHEVRHIIDQVRAEGVPAVFGSEVFPSDVLAVIAEETGARYVADLSDDELPGEPGDPEHSYAGLMRSNARTIIDALGGDPTGLDAIGLPPSVWRPQR